MSDNNEFKKLIDKIQIEIDPEEIESTIRNLQAKAKQLANEGMYTKVRVKFRDRVIVPEIPLGVFIAAEAATFWYAGLVRALAVNLGMRSFIDVEFIHKASEKVAQGRTLYEEGEVDAAEKAYREALDMRADDPYACYHLGVLLRVTGRREEAIQCFEAAAATQSDIQAKAKEALERLKRGARTL